MDWSFLPSLGDIGASALLSLVVLLILTGRIVPKSSLEEVRQDRNYWRKAYETSESARRLQDEALKSASTEIGKTAVELLDALRNAASHGIPPPS